MDEIGAGERNPKHQPENDLSYMLTYQSLSIFEKSRNSGKLRKLEKKVNCKYLRVVDIHKP